MQFHFVTNMYNFDIAFLTHHYYILFLSALKKKNENVFSHYGLYGKTLTQESLS